VDGVIRLACLFSILLLATAGLQAQSADRERMARAFEQGGDLRGAARLYLELLKESPSSKPYFDGVVRTLTGLGQYESLLPIVDSRLQLAPSVDLALLAAGTAAKAGKPADKYWALAREIGGASAATLATIGQAQAAVLLNDLALASFLEARTLSADPLAFAEPLRRLYSARGRYSEATAEVLKMYQSDGDLEAAQGRLSALMATPEGAEAVGKGLSSLDGSNPEGLRLYIWHAKHTGQWQEALRLVRKLDEMENEDGQLILMFADAALRQEAYPTALEAYGSLVDGPRKVALSAAYGFANTLDRQLASRSAISASEAREIVAKYREIVRQHADHPLAADALLRIGILSLEQLNDVDAARDALSYLTNRWKGTDAAADGALLLADIFYAADRRELAMEQLASVEKLASPKSELARMRRADYLLFDGKRSEARDLYITLSARTSSDAANDAIDRLGLLVLAADDSTTVDLYIQGLALQARRRTAEAAAIFVQAGNNARDEEIADRSRLEAARLFIQLSDTASASSQLEPIVARIPESTVGDRALVLIASILIQKGDRQGAIAALTTLLVQYPRSILAPTSRERIRRLRGDA
jgi:tetratricopeptide (TPR) repeat protein